MSDPSFNLCDDALRILREGGESPHSRPFFLRDQARPHRALLEQMRELKLVAFIGGDWLVTEAGRRVIGAPPESEVYSAWLKSRMPPKPALPPILNHYEASTFKRMRYAAFPAVRHADKPNFIVVSRDGDTIGHAALSKRLISIRPQSEGDFLLIIAPRKLMTETVWRKYKVAFLGESLALASVSERSIDELTAWERVKAAAGKANALIAQARDGGRRPLLTRDQAA